MLLLEIALCLPSKHAKAPYLKRNRARVVEELDALNSLTLPLRRIDHQ